MPMGFWEKLGIKLERKWMINKRTLQTGLVTKIGNERRNNLTKGTTDRDEGLVSNIEEKK
jgi:hypothetical protein